MDANTKVETLVVLRCCRLEAAIMHPQHDGMNQKAHLVDCEEVAGVNLASWEFDLKLHALHQVDVPELTGPLMTSLDERPSLMTASTCVVRHSPAWCRIAATARRCRDLTGMLYNAHLITSGTISSRRSRDSVMRLRPLLYLLYLCL